MASRSLALVPVSCVLLASSLVGCDPAVVPDAGTDAPVMRDAGPPPPPYTCEGTPTRVTGVLGATESVTFDTTMTTTRPRDLGLRCGNASAEVRWARQEVVEYVVPGSGPVAIEFSSVNSVTSPTFNTVIQVRRSCSEVPDQAFPPTCIDDTTRTEVRASGAYQAMGGETLYFIITGYSDPEPVTGEVDEGPIQVDFTPRSNTPPTITSASAAISGPAMAFSATANDAEGPIFGFALQLFTAAGQIDLEGDGDADSQDVIVFAWETVSGTGPYEGTSVITPEADGYRLADYCTAVGCTEVGISVFDRQYSSSAFLRVPITAGELGGVGDPCDGVSLVCTRGLTCALGFCQLTPAVTAACAAATPLALDGPFDSTPATVAVTGTVSLGGGTFNSPCSNGSDPIADSAGREAIYRLEITTPGTYTLALSTQGAVTGMGNTILYVRGADCWDSRMTNSIGCNDDVGGSNRASTLSATVMPGIYYIFVEFRAGTAGPFELSATLTRTGPAIDGGIMDAGVPSSDAGDPDAGADAGVDAPK